MSDPSALIDNLSKDLAPVKPIHSTLRYSGLWFMASVSLLMVLAYFTGPFRATALEQLTTHPMFAVDLLLGLSTIAVLSMGVFRLLIPGLKSLPLFIAGGVLLSLWVGIQFLGLMYGEPLLPASMEGKRAHCYLEGLMMSIPAIALGLFLAKKGYVINKGGLILGISVSAGLIPAWIMQFACMYEAHHNLVYHFGPLIVLTGIAIAVATLPRLKQYFN